MPALVRKGLLLSAAAGAVILGGAAAANAESSATAHSLTADSPGFIAGDTVYRIIWAPAAADGPAADSPGAVSADVPPVATDGPVQACGDLVATLRLGAQATGGICANGGPEAPTGQAPMGPPPMAPPPMGPPLGPPPLPPGLLSGW